MRFVLTLTPFLQNLSFAGFSSLRWNSSISRVLPKHNRNQSMLLRRGMVSPALLESNGIKAIDTEQLQEMLAQRTRSMHTTAEFLLVDVRSREGHEDGAIPGSMNIPLLELLDSMKERPASCLEEYVVEKYLQC